MPANTAGCRFHQPPIGTQKGAANATPFCPQAASASCPLITSPSDPAATRMVSPSLMLPSRINPAKGFCSDRWITRFNGRAP